MTTDMRFIHKNNGEVLTIEIAGETYTPEEVKTIIAEHDQSEEEATRWAMKYAQMCEALKLERAGTLVRDARIIELERECAALRLDNAALQKGESEAWDKAEYYEDVVTRLVLYFDCPNPSAIVEHIQALFEQRERALIDLENWIVAAERAGLSMPRPASFGQWRRPEGNHGT